VPTIFAPEVLSSSLKIAVGDHTTVAASDTVDTGLSKVLFAIAQFRDAPILTGAWVLADKGNQTGTPAAGKILIKSYKDTSAADPTPAAASTPFGVKVSWIAFGY
jgi:hypothetical protein